MKFAADVPSDPKTFLRRVAIESPTSRRKTANGELGGGPLRSPKAKSRGRSGRQKNERTGRLKNDKGGRRKRLHDDRSAGVPKQRKSVFQLHKRPFTKNDNLDSAAYAQLHRGTSSAAQKSTEKRQKLYEHEMHTVSGMRRITLNPLDPAELLRFTDNTIVTTKYTWINFMPKNFFEQLQRLPNIWILFLLSIHLLPIRNPFIKLRIATLPPFIMFMLFTATKDIIEDYKRSKLDQEVNRRRVLMLDHIRESFQLVPWSSLRVGNIIQLWEGDDVPADIIPLVSSSMEDGLIYIQTTTIDGCTDLKARYAIKETKEKGTPHDIAAMRGTVSCSQSTTSLDTFQGSLRLEAYPRANALDIRNFIARGSRIRNTDWLYGLVIYTGSDTRLSKNKQAMKTKKSVTDKILNRATFVLLLVIMTLGVIYAIGASTVVRQMTSFNVLIRSFNIMPEFNFLEHALNFLMAIGLIIPLLVVGTMDVLRFIGGRFITNCPNMTVGSTNAKVYNSRVCDSAGQVDFLFTDKTGTLTLNDFCFTTAYIDGKVYGDLFTGKQYLDVGSAFLSHDTSVYEVSSDESESSSAIGESFTVVSSKDNLSFTESPPTEPSEMGWFKRSRKRVSTQCFADEKPPKNEKLPVFEQTGRVVLHNNEMHFATPPQSDTLCTPDVAMDRIESVPVLESDEETVQRTALNLSYETDEFTTADEFKFIDSVPIREFEVESESSSPEVSPLPEVPRVSFKLPVETEDEEIFQIPFVEPPLDSVGDWLELPVFNFDDTRGYLFTTEAHDIKRYEDALMKKAQRKTELTEIETSQAAYPKSFRESNSYVTSRCAFTDTNIFRDLNKGSILSRKVDEFLRVMALCNTAFPYINLTKKGLKGFGQAAATTPAGRLHALRRETNFGASGLPGNEQSQANPIEAISTGNVATKTNRPPTIAAEAKKDQGIYETSVQPARAQSLNKETAATIHGKLRTEGNVPSERSGATSPVLNFFSHMRWESSLLKSIVYQANSPDDECLVSAASHLGYSLISRTKSQFVMQLGDSLERFELVGVNSFSSERRRMSVVISDLSTGQGVLYCKGSSSAIKDILDESEAVIKNLDKYIKKFNLNGLRTLALCCRYLSEDELTVFKQMHLDARMSIYNRDDRIEKVALSFERDMQLLGITGVREKLQPGVGDAIDAILDAGIRL